MWPETRCVTSSRLCQDQTPPAAELCRAGVTCQQTTEPRWGSWSAWPHEWGPSASASLPASTAPRPRRALPFPPRRTRFLFLPQNCAPCLPPLLRVGGARPGRGPLLPPPHLELLGQTPRESEVRVGSRPQQRRRVPAPPQKVPGDRRRRKSEGTDRRGQRSPSGVRAPPPLLSRRTQKKERT